MLPWKCEIAADYLEVIERLKTVMKQAGKKVSSPANLGSNVCRWCIYVVKILTFRH